MQPSSEPEALSNMAAEDWHMVDYGQEGSDAEGDGRSLDSGMESTAAQALGSERPYTPFTENLSDHEDPAEEVASPESENLADSVLCQPVEGSPSSLSSSHLEEASAPHPSTEEPAGDEGRSAASSPSHWRFDRACVRAASRVSGEGALEGFADPSDLMMAAPATAYAQAGLASDSEYEDQSDEMMSDEDGSMYLGWEGIFGGLGSLAADVSSVFADFRGMVASTARKAWSRLQGAKVAAPALIQQMVVECKQAAHQTVKAANRSAPGWAVVVAAGVAAGAMAALLWQVTANQRMVGLLRQRDRELARLVVKIMNLQDVVHNASRSMPVLRHISMDRFAATSITSAL